MMDKVFVGNGFLSYCKLTNIFPQTIFLYCFIMCFYISNISKNLLSQNSRKIILALFIVGILSKITLLKNKN